jgi:two-component system OmpR family response regulator
MEILIVEDDGRTALLLKRGLDREGHVATIATNGPDGVAFASERPYDVIVLDVMLPGMDGFAVARALRKDGNPAPILMLTARDGSKDIVAGLDSGADDYLKKPFAFEELLARIRALARRGPSPREAILSCGDQRHDPATREVWLGERRVELTRREFQILELLVRRAGRVQSRDSLIEAVWGPESDLEPNTIDVFMSSLRRKLHESEGASRIHTVRGIGFCLGNRES